MRAKEVDGGHQHQPGEDAAGKHDGGHTSSDNVAHSQILRRAVRADAAALQQVLRANVKVALGAARPQRKEPIVLEQRIQAADAQAEEDPRGKAAAAFARHQHVGAGRALGIDQRAVLFHNELAAQRNHEQHAQPAAKERERKDAARLQVEPQEDQRRQRENDAGGDGLARVASGLDDVVLQNAGAAKHTQDGDGEHRDGNAGCNRKSSAQADIHRDRAKDDAEERAQQQRAEGQLGA